MREPRKKGSRRRAPLGRPSVGSRCVRVPSASRAAVPWWALGAIRRRQLKLSPPAHAVFPAPLWFNLLLAGWRADRLSILAWAVVSKPCGQGRRAHLGVSVIFVARASRVPRSGDSELHAEVRTGLLLFFVLVLAERRRTQSLPSTGLFFAVHRKARARRPSGASAASRRRSGAQTAPEHPLSARLTVDAG